MSELRAKTDKMTGYQIGILSPHHKIHEKAAFATVIVNESMGADEELVAAFKTPVGLKQPHLTYEFMCLVDGHIDVIEGATWDAETGTLVPVLNRFRETVPTSSIILENSGQEAFTASNAIIQDPDNVAGAGTPAVHSFGVKNFATSQGGSRDEWILMPDTQYVIRLTAGSAANKGQIILKWYEHTDES